MFLGIDFSGGANAWKAHCSKPTVWIAAIEDGVALRLIDLRPVQMLPPQQGEPFTKLLTLLREGAFEAAGIDAPFGIPNRYMPPGGHDGLLDQVSKLPLGTDRPFPMGAALVDLAATIAPFDQKKPYRKTEQVWIERGVNTRSTLWNGPRGGAAFTAACLTLLARSGRPIWPWKGGAGMLVEAFPAAQLLAWGLPYKGYSKPEQSQAREQILVGLAQRLDFTASQQASMLTSPDALDAVIAAFAAIAAVRQIAPPTPFADGLIAVMDDAGPPSDHSVVIPPPNLLRSERQCRGRELLETVLRRPGVKIERIISQGHTTPVAEPYVQDWDEWVLVLTGSARLKLVGLGERSLTAGDHLLIPAGVAHRVTYTEDPTIWLVVHLGKA